MPIKLQSTGGGSVSFDVPSTASTYTLTAPAETGTVITTGAATRIIPKAAMPAGTILQTVQSVKTDSWSTVGTTWTDITGLSVSITPTSSSNKILIIGSVVVGTSTFLAYINLLRNSTNIAQPVAGTGQILVTGTSAGYVNGTNEIYNATPISVTYIDSPATTSATTYKFQARGYTAGVYAVVNRTYSDRALTDYEPRTISSITAMEIAV